MKDKELLEIEKPKGYYETVKEFYKNVNDYDENGNIIGTHKEVTGKVVKWVSTDEIEIKKERIKELKNLLAATDYRAIKYAEGQYTKTEYAPYKEQRQAYRDEINQLEKELDELNKPLSEEDK